MANALQKIVNIALLTPQISEWGPPARWRSQNILQNVSGDHSKKITFCFCFYDLLRCIQAMPPRLRSSAHGCARRSWQKRLGKATDICTICTICGFSSLMGWPSSIQMELCVQETTTYCKQPPTNIYNNWYATPEIQYFCPHETLLLGSWYMFKFKAANRCRGLSQSSWPSINCCWWAMLPDDFTKWSRNMRFGEPTSLMMWWPLVIFVG